MDYDIHKMAEVGKLWNNQRIYFNAKHLSKFLRLNLKTTRSGEILLSTIKGKYIPEDLVYRILSFSNLYFDLRKSEFVLPSTHQDEKVEKYILKKFDQEFLLSEYQEDYQELIQRYEEYKDFLDSLY